MIKKEIKALVENLANYNLWANQKITNWLLNINEEKLYQKADSSYESIDLTLQHMLRVQKFWFKFIKNEIIKNHDWSIREKDVVNVINELITTSQNFKEFVSNYNQNELSELLKLDMPWAKNTLPRYEYILHNINHNTFHRGQIITIARQIGLKDNIPGTDYNIYNSVKQQLNI